MRNGADLLVVHDDGELYGARAEDVGGAGIVRQNLTRGRCQDNGPGGEWHC